MACIGRDCRCKKCKQTLSKGGDVIWHGGDGGSFECSLSLLVKSMDSTTFLTPYLPVNFLAVSESLHKIASYNIPVFLAGSSGARSCCNEAPASSPGSLSTAHF